MKLPKHFSALFLLATLAPAWSGCKTHGTVNAIGDGYEEVSHRNHDYIVLAEPLPPRISFQYRNPDGAITPIWSELYGVNEVVHDGVAIFIADKAYMDPDRETRPRIFAVKSPNLPIDITDEVLREWAQATKRDFHRTEGKYTLATPEEENGDLKLVLEFESPTDLGVGVSDWPNQSALLLEWSQLAGVMQTVKAKGKVQKDLHWHTEYIGESASKK